MDQNKLIKLRTINYSVRATCETCKHSNLSKDGWGVCKLHTYSHLKHNEKESQLSIVRHGSCKEHVTDANKLQSIGLHGFMEFVELTEEKSGGK